MTLNVNTIIQYETSHSWVEKYWYSSTWGLNFKYVLKVIVLVFEILLNAKILVCNENENDSRIR